MLVLKGVELSKYYKTRINLMVHLIIPTTVPLSDILLFLCIAYTHDCLLLTRHEEPYQTDNDKNEENEQSDSNHQLS